MIGKTYKRKHVLGQYLYCINIPRLTLSGARSHGNHSCLDLHIALLRYLRSCQHSNGRRTNDSLQGNDRVQSIRGRPKKRDDDEAI